MSTIASSNRKEDFSTISTKLKQYDFSKPKKISNLSEALDYLNGNLVTKSKYNEPMSRNLKNSASKDTIAPVVSIKKRQDSNTIRDDETLTYRSIPEYSHREMDSITNRQNMDNFKLKQLANRKILTEITKDINTKRRIKRKVHNLLKNKAHDICDNFEVKLDNFNGKVLNYQQSDTYKKHLVSYHSKLRFSTIDNTNKVTLNPQVFLMDIETRQLKNDPKKILEENFTKNELKQIFLEPGYYINTNNYEYIEYMKFMKPSKLVSKLNIENDILQAKNNLQAKFLKSIDDPILPDVTIAAKSKRAFVQRKSKENEKVNNKFLYNQLYSQRQKEAETKYNIIDELKKFQNETRLKLLGHSKSNPKLVNYGNISIMKISDKLLKNNENNKKTEQRLEKSKLKFQNLVEEKNFIKNSVEEISKIYKGSMVTPNKIRLTKGILNKQNNY